MLNLRELARITLKNCYTFILCREQFKRQCNVHKEHPEFEQQFVGHTREI